MTALVQCFAHRQKILEEGKHKAALGRRSLFNAGPALSLYRESSVGAFDRSTGTGPFRPFIRLALAFLGSRVVAAPHRLDRSSRRTAVRPTLPPAVPGSRPGRARLGRGPPRTQSARCHSPRWWLPSCPNTPKPLYGLRAKGPAAAACPSPSRTKAKDVLPWERGRTPPPSCDGLGQMSEPGPALAAGRGPRRQGRHAKGGATCPWCLTGPIHGAHQRSEAFHDGALPICQSRRRVAGAPDGRRFFESQW
jgi:hypothetical protein